MGEDTIPAITRLVNMGEEMTFTQETGEDDAPVYQYHGLESGGAAAEEYANSLVDVYKCIALDENGASMRGIQDFSAESGEARIAKKGAGEVGVLEIRLEWTATDCYVSLHFDPEGTLEEPTAASSGLTVAEALQALARRTPAALGLDGEDLSAYRLFAEDGLSIVDGSPCYTINVYVAEAPQIAGTYLVSVNGGNIYRLDRQSSMVSAVA